MSWSNTNSRHKKYEVKQVTSLLLQMTVYCKSGLIAPGAECLSVTVFIIVDIIKQTDS